MKSSHQAFIALFLVTASANARAEEDHNHVTAVAAGGAVQTDLSQNQQSEGAVTFRSTHLTSSGRVITQVDTGVTGSYGTNTSVGQGGGLELHLRGGVGAQTSAPIFGTCHAFGLGTGEAQGAVHYPRPSAGDGYRLGADAFGGLRCQLGESLGVYVGPVVQYGWGATSSGDTNGAAAGGRVIATIDRRLLVSAQALTTVAGQEGGGRDSRVGVDAQLKLGHFYLAAGLEAGHVSDRDYKPLDGSSDGSVSYVRAQGFAGVSF